MHEDHPTPSGDGNTATPELDAQTALADLVAYVDRWRHIDRPWIVRFTPATAELARARDVLRDHA